MYSSILFIMTNLTQISLLLCVTLAYAMSLAASASASAATSAASWDLLTEVDVGGGPPGAIRVRKYRSRRTGLTLVLGEAESPIVNAYLCLATEAFDDDGLPHTLEHLIFLGSEDYPYKEVREDGKLSMYFTVRTLIVRYLYRLFYS